MLSPINVFSLKNTSYKTLPDKTASRRFPKPKNMPKWIAGQNDSKQFHSRTKRPTKKSIAGQNATNIQ